MKALILVLISLISFNLSAGEVGEVKKTDCPFVNQSAKKDIKPIQIDPLASLVAPKSISK